MPPPPADTVMSWTELWPTLDTPPEKEVQGWTLWGQQMKVVDAYKYLGVWFDRHLTMKRHCDMMKCKGMLKLQSFQNMVGFSDGNGVPADLIPNLFEAYVLSAVVYGMELCEEHGPPVVDTLTTRLTRWMAGYPRRGAPSYPLRRDFGFQSGLAMVWKRYSVLAGILQGMDSDRSKHRLHTAARLSRLLRRIRPAPPRARPRRPVDIPEQLAKPIHPRPICRYQSDASRLRDAVNRPMRQVSEREPSLFSRHSQCIST